MDELRLELHDAHVRDKLRHDRQELQDWQDYKKSLDDPGQRKTRLESMLQRDVSEEYQQQQTAAAQVKQQTEDSKTRLRLREETLKNAPATGIEKNVTDAEIAHFSDRGRLFQSDRGRRFNAIVDARRCAQARGLM